MTFIFKGLFRRERSNKCAHFANRKEALDFARRVAKKGSSPALKRALEARIEAERNREAAA